MNYKISKTPMTEKELEKLKIFVLFVMVCIVIAIGCIGYYNSKSDPSDTQKYEIDLKVETVTSENDGIIQILTIESPFKFGYQVDTMKQRLDNLYVKAKIYNALHSNTEKNIDNLAWMHIKQTSKEKEPVELKMLLGPSDLSETLSVPIKHNEWYRFEYNPDLLISGLAVI
jgi:hypothetical protein|tara:strand:+ start:139 stop:651 length:513 start_codon:yes stop_codon:yes gene_type:complete